MKKLLFLIFIGAGSTNFMNAETYELYRKFGLLTEALTGGDAVLLSKTAKQNTWGPTKKLERAQKNVAKFGKSNKGPLTIQTADGNYVVYIINKDSEPTKQGTQFKWFPMADIYPAIQKRNNTFSFKDKPYTLDPRFFDALVNDAKNPQGFVVNSVNQRRGVESEDLNYSEAF
jgi:hypothetical protein